MNATQRSTGSKSATLQQIMRARRLELTLSQADVARAIGVSSPDYISLVEAGTRKLHLDRIPRLAEVLQLNPQDLARIALNENCPLLYRALFENVPPAVREDTQQRFSYERDLLQKLEQLDSALRSSLIRIIETLYRKQKRASVDPSPTSAEPSRQV